MFSFKPEERKQQLGDFFNGDGFDKAWQGFDFFIDVDNEDLSKAHADAKKVKKVLDEFSVPYYILFSGRAGFHFVCEDSKFFLAGTVNADKVLLSYLIAENIRAIEDAPSIDMTIYDRERLRKVAYSLVGENVALPLSDTQFEAFDVTQMHYKHVLSHISIKNRGLLERDKIINFKGLMSIYGKLYK